MEQGKIVAAISEKLNENLNHTYIGYEINCHEIATEIATAITSHLEVVESKSISEQIDQFIAENGGNTMDALNVALARLEAALNKVLVLEEMLKQEQEENQENLPDSQ